MSQPTLHIDPPPPGSKTVSVTIPDGCTAVIWHDSSGHVRSATFNGVAVPIIENGVDIGFGSPPEKGEETA
jgi:hypothetical protein